jgi:carbon storage regulator CsrA
LTIEAINRDEKTFQAICKFVHQVSSCGSRRSPESSIVNTVSDSPPQSPALARQLLFFVACNLVCLTELVTKECAMLVLARKTKETIRIGDQITISVLRIKGNSIRLGIEAPDNVRIVRGEIATTDIQPPASLKAKTKQPPTNSAPQEPHSETSTPAPLKAQARLNTESVNRILASKRRAAQAAIVRSTQELVAS